MAWRILAVGFVLLSVFSTANAADTPPGARDGGTFSPKNRQADLARLRDFVYPQGYSEQTIIALENDQIPSDLPVHEFARLHCGESNSIVLYPCMIRYTDRAAVTYYVVAQGANMRFGDLASAAEYFRVQVTDTAAHFQMEIDVMNMFVDDFCAQIAAGARANDILRARGGDRPRINHPIAPPDPNAKYQFSDLFSWERCAGCVGIVAVNQPDEQPAPTCGALRKQATPHIAYFVVDRDASRGHRSLDDSLGEFTRRIERRR